MERIHAVYYLIRIGKNQILMLHNKDVDAWSMPGGKVEVGETLKQAAICEVKEEPG